MNFHCLLASLSKNNLVFRLSRLLFSMKMFYRDTVDGRNPAPFDMVNIYRALYMPGGAGFLPSTVLLLPCSKSLCLDFLLSETKWQGSCMYSRKWQVMWRLKKVTASWCVNTFQIRRVDLRIRGTKICRIPFRNFLNNFCRQRCSPLFDSRSDAFCSTVDGALYPASTTLMLVHHPYHPYFTGVILRETNMFAPENQWFENQFPFWHCLFSEANHQFPWSVYLCIFESTSLSVTNSSADFSTKTTNHWAHDLPRLAASNP